MAEKTGQNVKEQVENHPFNMLSKAISAELSSTSARLEEQGFADENEVEFQEFLQGAKSKVDLKIAHELGMTRDSMTTFDTDIKSKDYDEGWKALLDGARDKSIPEDKYLDKLDSLFAIWKKAKKLTLMRVA